VLGKPTAKKNMKTTGHNMQTSIKDQFRAIRRIYRVAHRTPILADGAIQMRMHATSAIRAFTGKWDNCEIYSRNLLFCPMARTSKGKTVYKLPVYRACTQWLKAH
jgi:hypothetical protein